MRKSLSYTVVPNCISCISNLLCETFHPSAPALLVFAQQTSSFPHFITHRGIRGSQLTDRINPKVLREVKSKGLHRFLHSTQLWSYSCGSENDYSGPGVWRGHLHAFPKQTSLVSPFSRLACSLPGSENSLQSRCAEVYMCWYFLVIIIFFSYLNDASSMRGSNVL